MTPARHRILVVVALLSLSVPVPAAAAASLGCTSGSTALGNVDYGLCGNSTSAGTRTVAGAGVLVAPRGIPLSAAGASVTQTPANGSGPNATRVELVAGDPWLAAMGFPTMPKVMFYQGPWGSTTRNEVQAGPLRLDRYRDRGECTTGATLHVYLITWFGAGTGKRACLLRVPTVPTVP